MIVNETPPKRGRKSKYEFSELKPGQCLKIEAFNIDGYRRIMNALKQWKDRNNPTWQTTTRYDNGVVSVYRLS